MCLIGFAFQAHPEIPLLIAANRDERHARPASGADFWDDAPEVLGGRDLEGGGTWLGVTRGGRVAALRWEFAAQQPGPLEKFLPESVSSQTERVVDVLLLLILDLVLLEILHHFHLFRDIQVDLEDMMVVLIEMIMAAEAVALVEQDIMQEPPLTERVDLDQFLQLLVMVVSVFRY